MIIDITTRRPAPIPEPEKHPDDFILGLVADWNVHRAKVKTAQAMNLAETRCYTRDESVTYSSFHHIEEMRKIEGFLSEWKPHTAHGAHEMLGVCLDILIESYRDPEDVLSDGPLIEIIKVVRKALEPAGSLKLERRQAESA